MSSPSASSSTSSGRSSPEPMAPLPPNARRGSAPASAFLPPRFWHSHSGGAVPTTSTVSSTSWDAWSHTQLHQGSALSAPRRTSFGTALGGGRLSALSALGMSAPPAQHHLQHHQQHMASHAWHHSLTAPRSPTKSTASLSSAPSAQSTMPTPAAPAAETPRSSSKDARPPTALKSKRSNVCFLPGPDGICVETRRRRGSQSQA